MGDRKAMSREEDHDTSVTEQGLRTLCHRKQVMIVVLAIACFLLAIFFREWRRTSSAALAIHFWENSRFSMRDAFTFDVSIHGISDPRGYSLLVEEEEGSGARYFIQKRVVIGDAKSDVGEEGHPVIVSLAVKDTGAKSPRRLPLSLKTTLLDPNGRAVRSLANDFPYELYSKVLEKETVSN